MHRELEIPLLDMDIGYGVLLSLEMTGITTIGKLLAAMQDNDWYHSVQGTGPATSRELERLLRNRGLYTI